MLYAAHVDMKSKSGNNSMSRTLAALLLFLSVGLCADESATGTVYETSFEEGEGFPKGWPAPRKEGAWEWASEGHTGRRCLCLIGRDRTTAAVSWVSGPIPLERGRVYRVNFWYKVEDKEKKRSISMGTTRVNRSFTYSADWRRDSMLFWVPPKGESVRLQFHLWRAEAKYFLDDVSIEPLGIARLRQGGLVLGRYEKIENGAYVFDWQMNYDTLNVCRPARTNTTTFLGNRTRLYKNTELSFKFELGSHQQLDGKVALWMSYYDEGEAIVLASRDEKTWTELGRMKDKPKIKDLRPAKEVRFDVPASLYPAERIFLKIDSRGYSHITRFRYEAKLSGAPPNAVGKTEFFRGHMLTVDNGVLTFRFDQTQPSLVSLSLDDKYIGSLECTLAQFEKEGLGYKGTGIESADATGTSAIEVKKKEPAECVVEVTAERSLSTPCMRRFEATYRLTIPAGQRWFRSKLLSVKNTDSMTYTLKGYYHRLNPGDGSAAPVCFPTSAGWLSETLALGALMDRSEPFTLGLRRAPDGQHGDITRRLDAKLNPGMTWEGNEPEIILFVSPEGTARALYRAAQDVKEGLDKPPSEAAGQITYEERKQEQ